jgi:transketolase
VPTADLVRVDRRSDDRCGEQHHPCALQGRLDRAGHQVPDHGTDRGQHQRGQHAFDGFWGACSTYGAFTYLKYGPMRLFSQLAQDSELQVGKLLYVASHSGPETAEDSRTHFGIYEPGMTQLFPTDHVIDLHPWEYNEVPVVLAAALRLDVPIVALHLTRPPVTLPDRREVAIPHAFAAARGAYIIRDYQPGPRDGVVVVRGSLNTATVIDLLPDLTNRALNVKIVAAISPQLFARQESAYRDRVLSPADRWDVMVITNGALRFMADWYTGPTAAEFSLTPDWDGRWRTGGTVAEVMDEAHLDRAHILDGIARFAAERPAWHRHLRTQLSTVAPDPSDSGRVIR